MLTSEIIEQATLDSGMQINNTYGLRWVNEALNLLANLYDTACAKSDYTLNVDDINEYYDLWTNCVRVKRVVDSDGDTYDNYTCDNSQIKFEDEDTYNVTILIVPPKVVAVTETPGVNKLYHLPIVYFLVYKQLENHKPEKSSEFYNRFMTFADSANKKLLRMKKKGKIPAPPYR